MDSIRHNKLLYTHCTQIALLHRRIGVSLQKRSTEWSNIIQRTQLFLFAIFFLDLRIDKTILRKHQTPFSCVTSRFVLSIFVLDNSFFIQVIHKPNFIVFAVKVSYKWRTSKHLESVLNAIGVTQAGVAYQPNIDLLIHSVTSNQYPINKYS